MTRTGIIYGVNGPIVHVKGDVGFEMHEMVTVGKDHLVGEVIGLASDSTTIQVYEETTGIKPGETVEGTGAPVSVTLAPGILNNIFDGIERPLSEIAKTGGAYIPRGVNVELPGHGKAVGHPHHRQGGRSSLPRFHHRGGSGDPCHRPQGHDSPGCGRLLCWMWYLTESTPSATGC